VHLDSFVTSCTPVVFVTVWSSELSGFFDSGLSFDKSSGLGNGSGSGFGFGAVAAGAKNPAILDIIPAIIKILYFVVVLRAISRSNLSRARLAMPIFALPGRKFCFG